MADWKSLQKKAKKALDEGVAAVKIGLKEAEFLAEATASATRLHVDANRRRFELYRTLHDLGALFFTALKKHPGATSVDVSEAMRTLAQRARSFETAETRDHKALQRFSVVTSTAGSAGAKHRCRAPAAACAPSRGGKGAHPSRGAAHPSPAARARAKKLPRLARRRAGQP